MAGTVGAVEDFVVEHREVKCKTKADWVCRRQFGGGNIESIFVGLERFVGAILSLVAGCEFSKITMIVTHPGRKENFTKQLLEDEVTYIL